MRTLTDAKVRSLKPAPDGKPYDVKDTEIPGLRVRVLGGGQRTFVLLARFPGSPNPTRRALGAYGDLTLEEARQKASAWRKLLRNGVDPHVQQERERLAELRQRQTTFTAVAEDFIRDKLPGERKGREAERDIRREFVPRWGKRPIAEITAHDVRDVVMAAKDRGAPYQAHNLLVLGRRLFSWAIDQQIYGLESSPCERLKPKAIIGKKVFRTRILDDDQLRAFWRATRRLGYPYGPLFRMLALTGQRKSEVAEARWSEIDLARKLWVIPAERMKADAAHVVPLSDDVIAILEGLPRFKKGDFLFSTTFGVKPVNGFSKAKERLDKRMRLSWCALGRVRGVDRRKAHVESWVIHDVRRTMRTGLSALPVSDLVRELVIAHTKPGLHRVYDQHAYLDEKRHALELWASRLRAIVEPAPANVVRLDQARG
ncbi:MAG: integrase arm-type DNA-binding domain-containing protein [Xanthobacteraceae bacterium]|jgi:integrase